MTTRDFVIKWLVYGIALLPVWFAQCFLLSSYPLFGVKPMLLPLCAMAVATLEGPVGGAGFGLFAGMVFDASVSGPPGVMILLTALLGYGAGTVTRYILRQDLSGCFLCSVAALVIMDLLRVLLGLFYHYPLPAMLELAGKEILWSLCFTPLIFLLFRWVFVRVPKATVL